MAMNQVMFYYDIVATKDIRMSVILQEYQFFLRGTSVKYGCVHFEDKQHFDHGLLCQSSFHTPPASLKFMLHLLC